MDVWLFAAAAGVGCVAQQWKKLRKGKQNLLDSLCRSPSFVLSESLQVKKVVQGESLLPYDALDEENVSAEESCSDREEVLIDTSMAETTSSSKPYEDDTVRVEGEGGVKGVVSLPSPTREMGILPSGFTRKRKSLTCRRTMVQSLKPLTSLESCVMAQFHKEQGATDDYNIAYLCSPHTQSSSPYLVARRSSVITRTMSDVFGLPNGATESNVSMDTFSKETTSISGVPQLPTIASKELRIKSVSQVTTVQGKSSYSSRRAKGKSHYLLPGGSSDDALIFLLGVSFGIMSSFWANKQEVDKLNGMLKTSENLVQDLQEELEMKETLTVKELTVEEDYEKENAVFNEEGPRNVCSFEENQDKAEEKCFSRIEAELEAELERLEINMSACRLREKPSDMVGVEEGGYIPDIVKGELKVKIFNEEDNDDPQPYADLDGSGSSPVHPADYAVSPRELSLKLHEVIHSRLELRVKELETALERRTQSKDRLMEPEKHTPYWREFSNSNSESSSVQASPVLDAVEQQQNQTDQYISTIVGNQELEEEYTPSSSKGIMDTHEEEGRYTWVYNARLHNSIVRKNPLNDEKNQLQEGIFSLEFISSEEEEEEEDGNEEMEMLLIQHIVEQARKGSPVVLNAQKMLFSPVNDDDDEP